MSALFVLQEPRCWNYFSVVAGHPFKEWISAVVQNKDGEGEGYRRCDERIGWESLVERERESFASPMWQSRSGRVPAWAPCPRGGSVWPALTTAAHKSQRTCDSGGRSVCLERRLVHICMWSGGHVTQQGGGGGGLDSSFVQR